MTPLVALDPDGTLGLAVRMQVAAVAIESLVDDVVLAGVELRRMTTLPGLAVRTTGEDAALGRLVQACLDLAGMASQCVEDVVAADQLPSIWVAALDRVVHEATRVDGVAAMRPHDLPGLDGLPLRTTTDTTFTVAELVVGNGAWRQWRGVQTLGDVLQPRARAVAGTATRLWTTVPGTATTTARVSDVLGSPAVRGTARVTARVAGRVVGGAGIIVEAAELYGEARAGDGPAAARSVVSIGATMVAVATASPVLFASAVLVVGGIMVYEAAQSRTARPSTGGRTRRDDDRRDGSYQARAARGVVGEG